MSLLAPASLQSICFFAYTELLADSGNAICLHSTGAYTVQGLVGTELGLGFQRLHLLGAYPTSQSWCKSKVQSSPKNFKALGR